MRPNSIILSIFLAVMALTLACGGPGGGNSNGNSSNTALPSGNDNNALAVKTPTPVSVTNNAPTLTPIYKAFCAAIEKNDEAGLRKVFSSDTIKFIEGELKAEGTKPATIVKYFEGTTISSAQCEVRNEKIEGDTGVANVVTKETPNGANIIFVKENGEWKLTNRFETAVKSNKESNSSTAK